MKLSDLLTDKAISRDVTIAGLTADSRAVKEGFLFAALPGTQVDGAKFIGDAIKAGAHAILCRPEAKQDNAEVVWITDSIPAKLFSHMVARYFDKQPDVIAAVTGTNGKTSVVTFTRQIWSHLGQRAASLGTLGLDAPDVNVPDMNIGGPALTTPDPVVLHEKLADLARHGVDHLAIEASSHGLEQYRLDGVRIDAAGFCDQRRMG